MLTNSKGLATPPCGSISFIVTLLLAARRVQNWAWRDAKWAPVNLKRDVEYPEMLDGVVDSLKRIADRYSRTEIRVSLSYAYTIWCSFKVSGSCARSGCLI